MAELSIAPAPGMTRSADPDSGKKSQFALFSDSWLEVQSYVGAALALPMAKGDFDQKYGTFGPSSTITDCIAAMKDVQQASTEFGDPKSLRAALIANPNLLATETPPTEIYTHTVWIGQRVHKTAATIASGYQSVIDMLPGMPAKEQVENLKAYLFDQTMGPIALSKTMSGDVGVLIQKLGKFEEKMNAYNEKLQAFTSGSSNMLALVNTTIGGLEVKIRELEKSRDEAYDAWKKFTIAAICSSVGCFLIGAILAPCTLGVSALVGTVAAVATATGLGIKATENRAKYNEYCKLIDSESADLKKKQRLRSDLGDFNTQMNRVGPAMASFLKNLQTVEAVWVQMNTDMVGISNSITPDNVGDLPFLVRAKANTAIDAWKAVDSSAKQFTVDSLVDYRSLSFGDTMPESIAA